MFRHIEFLRLGERRVLVILVAPDGDVQNRVIITAARPRRRPQLIEATNFLNQHYAGLSIDDVRERLKTEVEALSADIAALMRAAVQAGSDAIAESDEQVVVSRASATCWACRTCTTTCAACATCSTSSSRRRS